jgi:hypothetical protein
MPVGTISQRSTVWRAHRPWLASVVGWGVGLAVASVALLAGPGDAWPEMFTGGIVTGMVVGTGVCLTAGVAEGGRAGAHMGAALGWVAGALLLRGGFFHGPFLPAAAAVFVPLATVAGVWTDAGSAGARRRRDRLPKLFVAALALGVMNLFLVFPNCLVRGCLSAPGGRCSRELRQIDNAKQQWAIDRKKGPGDVPKVTDLVPTYLKNTPVCPVGGTYYYGRVEQDPRCTLAVTEPEHRLPL